MMLELNISLNEQNVKFSQNRHEVENNVLVTEWIYYIKKNEFFLSLTNKIEGKLEIRLKVDLSIIPIN